MNYLSFAYTVMFVVGFVFIFLAAFAARDSEEKFQRVALYVLIVYFAITCAVYMSLAFGIARM